MINFIALNRFEEELIKVLHNKNSQKFVLKIPFKVISILTLDNKLSLEPSDNIECCHIERASKAISH